jgi:hypothetical protein
MRHAQQRLTDVIFLAIDTETTSLFPMVHRLVEVGAACFRLDGRELATFAQLIDPQVLFLMNSGECIASGTLWSGDDRQSTTYWPASSISSARPTPLSSRTMPHLISICWPWP